MEKLTYTQICRKLALGESTPGYEIRWFNGNKPHDIIDKVIDESQFTIDGNPIPKPNSINIIGAQTIFCPEDIISTGKLLEFGAVMVATRFSLEKLQFIYTDEERIAQLNSYAFNIINSLQEKPLLKKDIVFNIKIVDELIGVEVYNAFVKNFEDLSEIYDRDMVVVDLNYDYSFCEYIY